GLKMEIPWVDRPPQDIVRDHVRFTLQPLDAPESPDALAKVLDHMGSDDFLLFSTDYPHWQFDGGDALPPGLPRDLVRKILLDNPLETYSRLREEAP
ncbi:MAG: amidohydrolase family protein, partial [Hyphomicrobiaceae bacterium]